MSAEFNDQNQIDADVTGPAAEHEAIGEPMITQMLPKGADVWIEANPQLAMWIGMAVLVGLSLLAYLVVAGLLLPFLRMATKRSKTWWDDVLVERKVFQRLVPLVPAFVLHWGITLVPHLPDVAVTIVQRVAIATMVVVIVRSFSALLTAVNDIYSRYPASKDRPIKGYLQVAKILAYLTAAILVIAVLMDREPWLFLSGLGAMTAVLLLIFRDTLLSLVAGIQLTGNDLIRVGDWIEMPQFNADGDVVDISLNVVRVQNWDRTFTVIPTHKFLEHSFKNYRSMFEGGGRRIMRSIHIDTSTIRFLTSEEIQRYSRFLLLKDYIREKVEELESYNREHVPSDVADVVANARHLTNIGTFRMYALNYLKHHPKIHQELLILVRQLEPTAHGLPLQLYAFTNDTAWVNYEGIQADIFDHLLAVAPEFGLRIFQEPSGNDLTTLGRRAVKKDRETAASDGRNAPDASR
jgi:miniconductance mechanosensitive channel